MRFQFGLMPLMSLLVSGCTLTAVWVQHPHLRVGTTVWLAFVVGLHVLLARLWNWTPKRRRGRRRRWDQLRRAGEVTAIAAGLAMPCAFLLPDSVALAVVWVAPSFIGTGACVAAATHRWSRVAG